MAEFLAELRRRHMFRIGGLYVVVAWGITQVIDVLSQIYALPDWFAQPILAVLVIGFPVTLLFAWTIVGAAKATDTLAELKKATLTDWVLIGAFAVVIILIGYQRMSLTDSASTATIVTGNEAVAVAGDIVENVSGRLTNSIAVLPFENLSPNPDDAYFAAGIHDEILSKLSKLQNLTVIARASVMRYAGDNIPPIPEIAEELNVEMVMAGTVRYAGDQVRVTAQLIDGMTNVPVWTTEDEGDLSDIFAIQSDIAMSIANSLQAEFSTDEQEAVEALPTNSTQAYGLFLRAMALVQTGLAGGSDSSVAKRATIQSLLDDTLLLDPEFALAHAWKARVYFTSQRFDPIRNEEAWLTARTEYDELILDHVNAAFAIDPNLGLAHAVLGGWHFRNLRASEAAAEAEEALRLDPNEPEVLIANAWVESMIHGRRDEALAYAQRSVALDPNTAQRHEELAFFLSALGMHGQTIEALDKCLSLDSTDNGCIRERAAAQHTIGNEVAAYDELKLMDIENGLYTAGTVAFVGQGFGLMGQSDDAQIAFDVVTRQANARYVDPTVWATAYMGIGNYEEALSLLNTAAENPRLIQTDYMPTYFWLNLWSNPRFEEPVFADVINRLIPK